MAGGAAVSALQLEALQRVFSRFCAYGSPCSPPSTMSEPKWQRLLAACGLAQQLGSARAGDCFREAACGGEGLAFEAFLRAIGVAARALFPQACTFEHAVSRALREHILALDTAADTPEGACSTLECTASPRPAGGGGGGDTSEGALDGSQTSPGREGTDATLHGELSLSRDTSSGTAMTVPTRALPLPPASESAAGAEVAAGDGGQVVRLGEDDLRALRQVFRGYALHWCSGRGRARAQRSLLRGGRCAAARPREGPRADALLPGDSGCSFHWTGRMCLGGFGSFVRDLGLAAAQTEAVREAFRRSAGVGGWSGSLDFSQFLAAVAHLVAGQLKSERGRYLPFGAAVGRFLRQCVQQAEAADGLTCSAEMCTCADAGVAGGVLRELLPREFRFHDDVVRLLEDALGPLRSVFAHHCGAAPAVAACRGGRCGGPGPVMGLAQLLACCRAFDVQPRFVREAEVRAAFSANGGRPLSFPRFLAVLARCALAGMSKYPHKHHETTAAEKMAVLLERMEGSRGMQQLFGHHAEPVRLIRQEPRPLVSPDEPDEPAAPLSWCPNLSPMDAVEDLQRSVEALGERLLEPEPRGAHSEPDGSSSAVELRSARRRRRQSRYEEALERVKPRPKRAAAAVRPRRSPTFKPHRAREPVSRYEPSRPVMSIFARGPSQEALITKLEGVGQPRSAWETSSGAAQQRATPNLRRRRGEEASLADSELGRELERELERLEATVRANERSTLGLGPLPRARPGTKAAGAAEEEETKKGEGLIEQAYGPARKRSKSKQRQVERLLDLSARIRSLGLGEAAQQQEQAARN